MIEKTIGKAGVDRGTPACTVFTAYWSARFLGRVNGKGVLAQAKKLAGK